MAAYRWTRTLVLPEGVAGDPTRPRGGVVPGSALAVFEVAAFLAAQMTDFYYRRWAEDQAFGKVHFLLSTWVDDFNMTVIGDQPPVVLEVLSSAAKELGETLEEMPMIPIGRDKTVVAASNEAMAKGITDDLRILGATAETTCRRLALRFALGAGGRRSHR